MHIDIGHDNTTQHSAPHSLHTSPAPLAMSWCLRMLCLAVGSIKDLSQFPDADGSDYPSCLFPWARLKSIYYTVPCELSGLAWSLFPKPAQKSMALQQHLLACIPILDQQSDIDNINHIPILSPCLQYSVVQTAPSTTEPPCPSPNVHLYPLAVHFLILLPNWVINGLRRQCYLHHLLNFHLSQTPNTPPCHPPSLMAVLKLWAATEAEAWAVATMQVSIKASQASNGTLGSLSGT